ncbi:tRNA uracil 4-sulfurtransferase ThiI [Alicyclobacillus sp. SO9]|uniref:tRNA uracil 4-sulfurtransferase ThiI n=1 Tax=Alicyclobacillus sp. SO9 TaxID=2665646 RepID=UPI0018E907EB|nr:tRNA uracil 4-sulfurtransferase ThiI [Alicyclobacillus sp. SO9]QQE80691.1 tRNA 4-thiouridine(8) synthase ThiI [Alicyclobacillus sp. SO9]
MIEHVIARYGEIVLKGKNRSHFEKVLLRNMQRALRDWPDVKVQRSGGRMLVHLHSAPVTPVVEALQRVFGIVSLSPVYFTDIDIDKIVETALLLMDEHKQTGASARTFKVEARRKNKSYPLTSPQIQQQVGGALLAKSSGWTVDVHRPDLTVQVEIGHQEAAVFGTKIKGLGGLPVGSGGKALLLLSGGIDSPVAGWLGMKRGVQVEAIHFHSYPFTSERALQKVEDLADILADWGHPVRLHTVHFTEVQTEIRKHCPDNLGITIMRRMMMRIATQFAQQNGMSALLTGESLGQVASQTLESMQTINAVTSLPVLRPLIAEDKVDIIHRARAVGTYETSILPYEDCCTIFVPKSPRTKPRIEEAETAEAGLDVDGLVERAVASITTKVFHGTEDV